MKFFLHVKHKENLIWPFLFTICISKRNHYSKSFVRFSCLTLITSWLSADLETVCERKHLREIIIV
uniref:Ovule protein n=1 Tax=Parascaris univalens TaxID=6257 RepID=A0A915AA74_PARUN